MITSQQIKEFRRKYSIGAVNTPTLATGANPRKPQNVFGNFFGDIGESLKSRFNSLSETGTDVIEGKAQPGEFAFQAVGQGAGAIFDPAVAAVTPIIQFASEQLAKVPGIEKIASSQPVDDLFANLEFASQKVQEFKKTDPNRAKNIEAGANIILALLGGKPAQKSIQAGLDVGKGVVRGVEGGAGAVADVARAGVDTLKTGFGTVETAAKSAGRIPSRIATNVAEKQATSAVINKLPSKLARQAARDGVAVADVVTLTKIPSTQKGPVRTLLKAVKDFASGETNVNPTEVVGKPLTSSLKRLDAQRAAIGQKLGAVAEKLGSVEGAELFPSVLNQLKKVPGLSKLRVSENGLLDFSETVLATGLTKSDRVSIQKIFTEAIKSGSGSSKHRLRQELFEILGGKKKSLSNITDTQEKAFQAIRQGLSNVLETKNSAYKTLSNEYRKVIKPLSDMRKLFRGLEGAEDDILDMASGLLARRLTSFAPSNPKIRNILRAMDKALKTEGKTLVNLENMQNVFNVLDKYYDIAAKTGFQGQITTGVGKAAGVSEFFVKSVQGLAGQTQAVRQKAVENLLNELLK